MTELNNSLAPRPAAPIDVASTSDVLFLCTGNAARSVIAAAALSARRPDLRVGSAGTLAVDGQPMSWRTRAALEEIGVAPPSHRSRQCCRADLDGAALVVGLAPEHVAWVRREHPVAASRTGTLRRLCRDGDAGLEHVELEPWEEVADPGGGELDVFLTCARDIAGLIDQLAARLA